MSPKQLWSIVPAAEPCDTKIHPKYPLAHSRHLISDHTDLLERAQLKDKGKRQRGRNDEGGWSGDASAFSGFPQLNLSQSTEEEETDQ